MSTATFDEASRILILPAEDAPALLAAAERLGRGAVVVPDDDEFEDDEYASGILLAPAIEAIGQDLIDRCDELRPLRNAEVAYVWKRAGGKAKGKPRWATCQHPTGILAFFAGADFVVAVAADHARDLALTGDQIEALLYHELRHCGWDIDKQTGGVRWVVRGHDWEGFRGEVERYGAWEPETARLAEAFRQAGLFGREPGTREPGTGEGA